MDCKKVSVIVPVYKVETYLVRCLDSLCRQSLRDIEIVLVDDASPDRCGEICEAYAEKDARFKVIHHLENRGLGAARNTGIAHATCDYLMFVDSDDVVHEDFCRLPYESAVKYQADLVMFNYRNVKDGVLGDEGHTAVLFGYKDREKAIELALRNPAAWNKLYHKKLFSGIRYPEGYLFEDVATTYKLFWNASSVYYLDNVLYYYCFRSDSITKGKNMRALQDSFDMNLELYNGLLDKGYSKEKLDVRLINLSLNYCMKKTPESSDWRYVYCANVLRNCKNIPDIFTWRRKVLVALFKCCRPLFELICFLYNTKVEES